MNALTSGASLNNGDSERRKASLRGLAFINLAGVIGR